MSFSQGLSGLNAASQALDVVGNNIANSQTVGFKSGSVAFGDVFAGSQIGMGVQVAGVNQSFTDGVLGAGTGSLDMGIQGNGFFRLVNDAGRVFYSRNGQFKTDASGYIVNNQGMSLTGYQATGAPSASESPADPSPATGQLTQEMGTPAWQQALGQQVACFTRNGIQHAELRLHPKELGSLQISLQLKNDQAELHFVSPSHQVRAAIEAAVPHLRTSLAESGIALGQSSVGAGSSQDGNPSGSAGQSFRPQGIPSQPGDRPASAEESADAVIPAVSYRNGINTFA